MAVAAAGAAMIAIYLVGNVKNRQRAQRWTDRTRKKPGARAKAWDWIMRPKPRQLINQRDKRS
jgi:hypothetical protein